MVFYLSWQEGKAGRLTYVVFPVDCHELLIVEIRADIPSHWYSRSRCPFVALRHIIQANFGKIKGDGFC